MRRTRIKNGLNPFIALLKLPNRQYRDGNKRHLQEDRNLIHIFSLAWLIIKKHPKRRCRSQRNKIKGHHSGPVPGAVSQQAMRLIGGWTVHNEYNAAYIRLRTTARFCR